MIRHSSSFFISIILHILLIVTLFYGYKKVIHIEQTNEKRVKINLCNITPNQKNIPKHTTIKKKEPQKKKAIQKIVIPIKKTVPVKKVKPIKKEKLIPKKKTIQKTVVKPIVEEIQIVEKVIVEKKIEEEVLDLEIKTLPPTKEEKNIQLEKDYMNEHIQKISQLLRDNLYYPRSARKRGITDNFVVKIKLLTSGIIDSIEVIDAKHKILSRAAVKTIENIADELPKPSQELIIHVPINYTLRR